MTDPIPELTRLSQHGTAEEQDALASAAHDQPGPAAYAAVVARVLAEHQARLRWRRRAVGVAIAGLSAAAALPLLLHLRAPQTERLVAEPLPSGLAHAEPHPSATPRAQPAPNDGGTSASEPCTPSIVAGGTQPLIDDFEDGDMKVPMAEHRAGQWLTFNDGTGPQSPKPGTLLRASRIPGGRGASHFGVHNVGGKFSKWGASLGLELSPRRCYDASAYGGIEFWARGRGEIRTVVQMTQVVSEEFGGSCSHDCFDAHAKRVQLSREFRRVVVRWEELRQHGSGTPVPFDPRSLFSIQFSVLPEQSPFDFWIDDVSFIPR